MKKKGNALHDVRAGLGAACRTLISDVVACSHSECVEWASENGRRRNRRRHFGVWKKMVVRGNEIHERGRFTIREISFLWGLGFLGNPITGVKCDLGSWPYAVHRHSHRLSTAMAYTLGVSYLFGTDTNRRAPRYSTASHNHGRFQPRSENYFLRFSNRYFNRRDRGWISAAFSRAFSEKMASDLEIIKYNYRNHTWESMTSND